MTKKDAKDKCGRSTFHWKVCLKVCSIKNRLTWAYILFIFCCWFWVLIRCIISECPEMVTNETFSWWLSEWVSMFCLEYRKKNCSLGKHWSNLGEILVYSGFEKTMAIAVHDIGYGNCAFFRPRSESWKMIFNNKTWNVRFSQLLGDKCPRHVSTSAESFTVSSRCWWCCKITRLGSLENLPDMMISFRVWQLGQEGIHDFTLVEM